MKDEMRCRVGDFSKVIAVEARYHKGCHSSYINIKTKPVSQPPSNYDKALYKMMDVVLPELNRSG